MTNGRLAPSDIKLAHAGGSLSVGGRVRHALDRRLLVDAFGDIEVERALADVPDGDFAVVAGTLSDAGIVVEATLLEHIPAGPRTGSKSDVARLAERGVARTLRARSEALGALRSLFSSMGFLEVETPAIVPCPGLDTHLDAFEVTTASSSPRYLITSPEYQMKRLLVGGVPRCFQFAKSFRKGEVGARHNPEFTMLEWYRAFGSVEDVMDDTERIVCAVDEAIGAAIGTLRGLDLKRPFSRLSVAEAFAEHAGIDTVEMLRLANDDSETFFRILVDQVEPALARSPTPVFLDRYPACMASLARLCPDDRRFAERFELYAAGVELCNGFGELTDPAEQRNRFEHDQRERRARGLPVYPIDARFVGALEEGMPPAAGNALGLDRLVMLALGASELGDVIAFPESEL
ncbi:MAG: EF-P lysine aminoacylase GenX [Polyangiaceae bacterium]|nr:EF-P lysine aminoacylase GenX [Polyangiaceae bacterium]